MSLEGTMEKIIPKIPPLVEIFWEDHYSLGEEWFEPDAKHEICILSAVGYLVSQDDKYYYVACTYEMDSGHYQSGTAVLKNCVVDFNVYSKADQPFKKQPEKSKDAKSIGSRKANSQSPKIFRT